MLWQMEHALENEASHMHWQPLCCISPPSAQFLVLDRTTPPTKIPAHKTKLVQKRLQVPQNCCAAPLVIARRPVRGCQQIQHGLPGSTRRHRRRCCPAALPPLWPGSRTSGGEPLVTTPRPGGGCKQTQHDLPGTAGRHRSPTHRSTIRTTEQQH